MELWFTEKHTEHVKFSIQVDRQLYSSQSEFQRIDIFSSKEFGRFLTLDGYMMLTEKDEFIYHEMMVHVPMAVHPKVRSVLVIGGGDGGTARELIRYPAIEQIDVVEIDEEVVSACRQHLPQTVCGFDDKRVRLYYEDGLKYVRRCEDAYDLILVDSTDPFGPGEGLFTKEFYGNCCKALKADGIMVNQHESPFQAHIPTYPSGHWLFGFASKRYHPLADQDAARWKALGIQTRYYNEQLHKGAFALPNYVEEMLEKVE